MSKLVKFGLAAAVIFLIYKGFTSNKETASDLPPDLAWLTHMAQTDGKKKIVILFTGTEWCPPCQNLERSIINTAPWKKFEEEEIQFQVFDFPAGGNGVTVQQRNAADHFKIQSFPTLIVADINGKVIKQQSGYRAAGFNYYRDWVLSPAG